MSYDYVQVDTLCPRLKVDTLSNCFFLVVQSFNFMTKEAGFYSSDQLCSFCLCPQLVLHIDAQRAA